MRISAQITLSLSNLNIEFIVNVSENFPIYPLSEEFLLHQIQCERNFSLAANNNNNENWGKNGLPSTRFQNKVCFWFNFNAF